MTIERTTPPTFRTLARRMGAGLRAVFSAVDAGSMIAHGITVPPDHPARRREPDRA